MDRESVARLQKAIDAEMAKLKEVVRALNEIQPNKQKLQTQLNENQLVKKELDLVSSSDVVWKLVGPVLVKQDVDEAKSNVKNRIEYFQKDIERLEKQEADLLEQRKAQEEKVRAIRESTRAAYQAAVERATKQIPVPK